MRSDRIIPVIDACGDGVRIGRDGSTFQTLIPQPGKRLAKQRRTETAPLMCGIDANTCQKIHLGRAGQCNAVQPDETPVLFGDDEMRTGIG